MITTVDECALSAFDAETPENAGLSPVDVIVPAGEMAVAVGILRAMLNAELVAS